MVRTRRLCCTVAYIYLFPPSSIKPPFFFLQYDFRNSIYRSNVVRSNLNPQWDEVTLSLEAACNGDMDRAIKVVVWDHRRSGKHKSMGEFETNMERIYDAANTSGVDFFTLRRHDKDVGKITVLKANLVRPAEKQQSSEKNSAIPQLPAAPSGIPESISVPDRPEFVDYLAGGCQISLAVAIDFTASNGTLLVRCVNIVAIMSALSLNTSNFFHCIRRGSSKTWHSSLFSSALIKRV